PALEHRDHRVLLEARVPAEAIELALQATELLLVVLLLDVVRQVERAEDVELVDRGHARRHTAGALRARRVEARAHRLEEDLARREGAVARVGALDHGPLRFGGARLPEDARADLLELVVLVVALPVLGRHAPARLRVLLELLETLFLRLLRDVEPQLHDERAVVREHALHAHDLFDPVLELALSHVPAHAREDRVRVPVAEEDAYFALLGHPLPEAPHPRPARLLLAHRPEGVRFDVAWVHPLVQEVDGLALAGAFDAVHEDDDREVLSLHD